MTILMINQDQFGYKAGYYHYCKHLVALGHEVVVVCRDHKQPIMELSGVEVHYVYEPNSLKWRIKCGEEIKRLIQSRHIDVALCAYFRGCTMLRSAFGEVPVIIDIRSGDISKGAVKRKLFNVLMKIETSFFTRRMILSQSLAGKLNLPQGSYDIVPLGADVISEKPKDYGSLKLLYVGTLSQRDIHKTVEAIGQFVKEFPAADISYDIVGFGSDEDESLLRESIEKNNLTDKVVFHGRVNYEHLTPFFDRANLGVAFVPMTPYYDCQPATKIYEYVLSGMYCIATKTYENRILITDVNGVLCEDSAESFCEALKAYYLKDKTAFSSEVIRQSMNEYDWKNVVCNTLLRNMEKLVTR